MAFLPPFVEPLLAALPEWVLLLMLTGLGLSLLGAIAALFIGKNAAEQMVGTLAADVVRFLFLMPFRCLRGLFRLLTGL